MRKRLFSVAVTTQALRESKPGNKNTQRFRSDSHVVTVGIKIVAILS